MDTRVYRETYGRHDFLYRDYRQAFEKAKISIRFPIAQEILFDLAERMDSIYQGMLDAAYRDNLYALYILYRSLIDHYVKIQYIVDKTAAETSDITAEKYKKHLFITEVLAEQMGVLQMEDLLATVEKQTDFLEFFRKKFPEMAGFDKENQKEISAAIKQFDMRAMIKHLTERYRQLSDVPNAGWVFASTLPEYSQVSSFTHGGAYAGQIRKSLMNDGKVEEQLHNKLHIGMTLLGVSKENALVVYELDRSILSIIGEFQKSRAFPAAPSEAAGEKG
jgi:hypothetical protein